MLGYPTLSRYAAYPTSLRLPAAYVLLEGVGPDTGRMLSDTWEAETLPSMACMVLSLARVPQPRIGSF